ncbi:hypothetical protein ACFL6Y_05675 [Elusimicrobiota bacterium]
MVLKSMTYLKSCFKLFALSLLIGVATVAFMAAKNAHKSKGGVSLAQGFGFHVSSDPENNVSKVIEPKDLAKTPKARRVPLRKKLPGSGAIKKEKNALSDVPARNGSVNRLGKARLSVKARKSKPTLWELQEKIKKDPLRKFLDSQRAFKGGKIYFHEISRTGLFSFEIVNEGTDDIFLPDIKCLNCNGEFEVVLERRVIDPGVKCYGVGMVKNIQKLNKLRLILKAVNLPERKITLEVPQWSV